MNLSREAISKGFCETLTSLAFSPDLSILVVSAVSSTHSGWKRPVLLLQPEEALLKLRISIDRVHKPQRPKRESRLELLERPSFNELIPICY
jgi:hypothetical protein